MSHSRNSKIAQELSYSLSKKFNTSVKVTREQVEEAKVIISNSKYVRETMIPYIHGMLKETGLKPSCAIVEGPCKILERMIEKAFEKHEGDVSKIPDAHRLRILVEKPEDIQKIRDFYLGINPIYYHDPHDKKKVDRLGFIFDQHPHKYITVRELEDYYRVPSSTGRIALHIVFDVKVPGKQIISFEVQVLHADMVTTEEFTRDNYVKAQEIKRSRIAQNIAEGNPDIDRLTREDKEAIAAYNKSSKLRYWADMLRLNLIPLLRGDLQRKAEHGIKAGDELPLYTPRHGDKISSNDDTYDPVPRNLKVAPS